MIVVKHINENQFCTFSTDFLLERISYYIHHVGKCNIALSGGRTPLAIFSLLATNKKNHDWKKVNFFWVDERYVPLGHPDNNFSSALQNGLKELNANFFPIPTDGKSINEDVRRYKKIISKELGDNKSFDISLLGAGDDFHTASIFLEDMENSISSETVVKTIHPKTNQHRISLTLSFISKSNEVILLLAGTDKAKVILELTAENFPDNKPINWVLKNLPKASILISSSNV